MKLKWSALGSDGKVYGQMVCELHSTDVSDLIPSLDLTCLHFEHTRQMLYEDKGVTLSGFNLTIVK